MPRRSSSSGRRAAKHATNPSSGERLQKVLAHAGVASRRECEQLIQAGRVEVDRQIITQMGVRVKPDQQEIRVDGVPLRIGRRVVYLVNKPPGVVCTSRDPEGRTRVIDLVPSEKRLFTVGRLDRTSEGLILVTNDGELANRLTHPRYGIPKTYRAKVLGHPPEETLKRLRQGIHLAEGTARVESVRSKGRHARGSELEIVLTEGRNREVRRVLARVGHKVLHLRRVALGPLRLGNTVAGGWRRLTEEEITKLRKVATSSAPKRSAAAKQPATAKQPAAGKRPTAGKRTVSGKRPAAGSARPKRSAKPEGKAKTGRPPATSHSQSAPKAGTVLGYESEIRPVGSAASTNRSKPTKGKPRK